MSQAQVPNKSSDQRPFPDVILKSQFFDTIGKRSLTSEQRLMLAVLADATRLIWCRTAIARSARANARRLRRPRTGFFSPACDAHFRSRTYAMPWPSMPTRCDGGSPL
jgi:hypothetical protein